MAAFLALFAQGDNMKSSEKRNIRTMIRSLIPRLQLSDKRALNVTNIRILFQFRKFFNGFPALKLEYPHVSRSLNSYPDTSIAANIGGYYESWRSLSLLLGGPGRVFTFLFFPALPPCLPFLRGSFGSNH